MNNKVRRVAVLGTGTMVPARWSAPAARGFRGSSVNRTWPRLRASGREGALFAVDTRKSGATGSDVLITMLTDGSHVGRSDRPGPRGALSMIRSGAIGIQMSTVGVEWTDRLADLADIARRHLR